MVYARVLFSLNLRIEPRLEEDEAIESRLILSSILIRSISVSIY